MSCLDHEVIGIYLSDVSKSKEVVSKSGKNSDGRDGSEATKARLDALKITDSDAFFKLLNCAAKPRPQSSAGTSASQSSGDCSDKRTHPRTSGDASAKRNGKSH